MARNVRILPFDLNPADNRSATNEKKLRISCGWLRLTIAQNYFLAEKAGNDLPENLLTLKGKIVISEAGQVLFDQTCAVALTLSFVMGYSLDVTVMTDGALRPSSKHSLGQTAHGSVSLSLINTLVLVQVALLQIFLNLLDYKHD